LVDDAVAAERAARTIRLAQAGAGIVVVAVARLARLAHTVAALCDPEALRRAVRDGRCHGRGCDEAPGNVDDDRARVEQRAAPKRAGDDTHRDAADPTAEREPGCLAGDAHQPALLQHGTLHGRERVGRIAVDEAVAVEIAVRGMPPRRARTGR
jgi:hypothetical protein